jgi:hypothetical protein
MMKEEGGPLPYFIISFSSRKGKKKEIAKK